MFVLPVLGANVGDLLGRGVLSLLSAAKNLVCVRATEILRCAQDDDYSRRCV
jgi:hypothetical protein